MPGPCGLMDKALVFGDDQRHHSSAAGLLHLGQVDALLGDYRTASAQDTQTQAAIAGALLAYRTGPDHVFTTNQITSALVAYRSAADQDTATASSIAAALPYYTITQVDGLLAGKLGVAEAASALQYFFQGHPLSGTAMYNTAKNMLHSFSSAFKPLPQQRLQRGPGHAHRGRSERGRLHPDPGGEPVEHRAHLQLDPGPRALPLPARHGPCPRQTTSTTPCTAASWATRVPGALPRCTSQCLRTGWRSCTSGRTSRRRACPTRLRYDWICQATDFFSGTRLLPVALGSS